MGGEALSEVNIRMDPRRMPTVFTLGLGTVIVGHSIHDGMPALFLCAAARPGVVDADAADEFADGTMPANAVVIRFASMEAVAAHAERCTAMLRNYEEACGQ